MSSINITKTLYKNMLYGVLLLAVLFLCCQQICFAQNNSITVFANKTRGEVNRNLFGTNLLMFEAKSSPYNQFTDYGGGIWDPNKKKHNLISDFFF